MREPRATAAAAPNRRMHLMIYRIWYCRKMNEWIMIKFSNQLACWTYRLLCVTLLRAGAIQASAGTRHSRGGKFSHMYEILWRDLCRDRIVLLYLRADRDHKQILIIFFSPFFFRSRLSLGNTRISRVGAARGRQSKRKRNEPQQPNDLYLCANSRSATMIFVQSIKSIIYGE